MYGYIIMLFMKRFFIFCLSALLLLGCSSSSDKVNPLIKGYLLEHLANPDTYVPGKTEVIEQGTIDVENTINWQDIPSEGDIDVVILRHEFSIADKSGALTDNAFIFYMNPDQDVIYYVHRDKGILLFPLD